MLTQEMNALARQIATATDGRNAAMAKLRKSGRAERDARTAAMAKLRTTLRTKLGKVRPELARHDATRVTSARTWLRVTAADRAGAHKAWQDLTATLHGKRVSTATTAPKVATAPDPPAAAAKAE